MTVTDHDKCHGSYKTGMTVYVVTVQVHHVDHQLHCACWPCAVLLNMGHAPFLEGNTYFSLIFTVCLRKYVWQQITVSSANNKLETLKEVVAA